MTSLRGGDGIRSRFLLVFDGDHDASITAAAQQLAGEYRDVVELRMRPGHDMTLVRPDGYIAHAARHRDAAALAAVRALLERQTATDHRVSTAGA